MPTKSSRVSDHTRVKRLISDFRNANANFLDANEKNVLRRFESDRYAIHTFAKIADQLVLRLLVLCLEADLLLRTFEQRVRTARERSSQLLELQHSLTPIRQFLDDCLKPPEDRLEASVFEEPSQIHNSLNALDLIEGTISSHKRMAAETPRRLGVTRKVRGKKAAETATIGWIADGVKRIMKKKNEKICLDLAGLILGRTVTKDRLSNAIETRKREWRIPLAED